MKKERHFGYYEAILQLREVNQDVLEFSLDEIEKRNVSIAKAVKLKTGVDYYLSDQQFTKALGKKLQKKFGGQLVVTAKLFGVRKGKEVYRVTVLFRVIHVKRGDTISYQGEEWLVKAITKHILAFNEHTKKKIHIQFKDARKIKVIS